MLPRLHRRAPCHVPASRRRLAPAAEGGRGPCVLRRVRAACRAGLQIGHGQVIPECIHGLRPFMRSPHRRGASQGGNRGLFLQHRQRTSSAPGRRRCSGSAPCRPGGENPQDLRFRCARRRTPTLQQHFLDHLHRREIAFQGERPMGIGRVSQSGLVAFGGVVPLRHTRGRRVWPESPSHGQNVSAGKTYARSRRPWMATAHTGSTRPVAGLCRTSPPVRPARTCRKSPKQTGGIRGPVPTENPGWTPPTQNPPTPGIPTTSAALRPLWQSPFHGGRPPSALPGSAWAGAPFREPAP